MTRCDNYYDGIPGGICARDGGISAPFVWIRKVPRVYTLHNFRENIVKVM
jgi:hypothetical protein